MTDLPHDIIRVFPRRTKATPTDRLAFVGDPRLPGMRPEPSKVRSVHISCTFSWDRPEGVRLLRAWRAIYGRNKTWLGGPAYYESGSGAYHRGFRPGMYLKKGYVITSRGCPNHCEFCLVPEWEGALRVLPIAEGWDVLDNNLLACPRAHVEAVLEMLSRQRPRPKFTGGLEAARMAPWFVKAITHPSFRLGIAYTAYDQPEQRDAVERAVKMLREAGGWSDGTARRRIGCYVLCGFNGEDDVTAIAERLDWVISLGATPFPMFYQGDDESRNRENQQMKRKLRRYMRPSAMFAGAGRK